MPLLSPTRHERRGNRGPGSIPRTPQVSDVDCMKSTVARIPIGAVAAAIAVTAATPVPGGEAERIGRRSSMHRRSSAYRAARRT